MYNIVIGIYLIGVAIASLFNEKVRKMWQGERRAIRDIKAKLDPEAKYVWVHAASLGEFEQGRPIIERLRVEHPEYKVLLTFFSPSGYEVRKNYDGADIVCYLPIDTVMNARRFLRTIHPVCALFIKYEFWYNYLHILKHRGVPVYSVSSIFRPGQIFFRWYGHQYGRVLKCFTHFFVQNEESKRLLEEKLKLTNVSVTGDTRFDRVLTIAEKARHLPVAEAFKGDKRLFIAGSSWQPDEQIFMPYFGRKKQSQGADTMPSDSADMQTAGKNDAWKLIIAPHVIAEFHLRQIETLAHANGLTTVRYTDIIDQFPSKELTVEELHTKFHTIYCQLQQADVLIVNCFGLLSSIYQYADVAYVGGGFGVSIHNLPEAAVWYKPVIFGPNNHKFQEAQDLKACEGGMEITDDTSFAAVMDRLSTDAAFLKHCSDAAGTYVASHSGATRAVLDKIDWR